MKEKHWSMGDAEANFIKLLDASVRTGPQVVTRSGVPVAVLISIEKWRALERQTRPNLKDLLLAKEPRVETLAVRTRGRGRRDRL